MNRNTIQNIGILVVAIAALAGGYWYFFADQSTEEPSSSAPTTNAPEEVRGLVELLHNLQEVEVNPAALDRIPFERLSDFHLEIPEQERGRENPFAPSSALPNPSSTQ